jgi:hypothetical protein
MLALIMALTMAVPHPSILSVPFFEPEVVAVEWTQEDVRALAVEKAKEYGLHKGRFLKTLECENNFNAKGQSEHYYKGKREMSFGSAQIHLPSHPGITQEMAEDPEFAITFMAQKWANGEARIWSCYNDLFR